ncbi:MAG: hypothetical protein GY721_10655, partial [Deltaproteobacteria bacterium]|nr:hypothetical protein [Deltaproteobacteria bacterium]
MLKEEEYFDFIRRDAGSDNVKPTTVNYTAVEDPFVTGYGEICHKLAGLGREKEELLQRVGKSTLTDEDEARLEKLDVILEEAGIEFARYLDQMITDLSKDSPELTREIIEETLKSIESLQGDLKELGHGAVLIHYLMTEEKLRMIVTLPHTQFHRDFDITS